MLRKTLMAAALIGAVAAPTAAPAADTINIIQPSNRSMIFWPIHVSEILGYFEEEGIELNLLASDTSVPYPAFLTNGSADLAMLDGPQTFQAVNSDIGIATVYTVHHRAPEGVYVDEKSPIQSVTELKGKTVGLASDRDLASLKVAMAHAGSNADGIKTVVVGDSGPVLANVFLKGTADAFAGSITDLAALGAQGIKVRDITPASAKNAPANTYAMMANRIDELKKPLCGFFRAYSKGLEVGRANIEAVAALSRHPRGVPEQWESASFGYGYLDAVDDLQLKPEAGKYGEVERGPWDSVMKDMILIGEIDKEIDVDTFLSDAFTECANDFDRAEVAAEVKAWMDDPENARYMKK